MRDADTWPPSDACRTRRARASAHTRCDWTRGEGAECVVRIEARASARLSAYQTQRRDMRARALWRLLLSGGCIHKWAQLSLHAVCDAFVALLAVARLRQIALPICAWKAALSKRSLRVRFLLIRRHRAALRGVGARHAHVAARALCSTSLPPPTRRRHYPTQGRWGSAPEKACAMQG
eukprot:IDg15127t1